MFDIVFLSYKEENANDNWEKLKSRFPYAKRVDGVEGLLNSHREAARRANTKMFYVVDGDNIVSDNFSFSFVPDDNNLHNTHIWRCLNPVNGLIYGYGGIKLFPKKY